MRREVGRGGSPGKVRWEVADTNVVMESDFLMNPDGAPSTSMAPHLVLCKGAALADVLLPVRVAGGRAPDGVPLVKVLLQHSAQAEARVGVGFVDCCCRQRRGWDCWYLVAASPQAQVELLKPAAAQRTGRGAGEAGHARASGQHERKRGYQTCPLCAGYGK